MTEPLSVKRQAPLVLPRRGRVTHTKRHCPAEYSVRKLLSSWRAISSDPAESLAGDQRWKLYDDGRLIALTNDPSDSFGLSKSPGICRPAVDIATAIRPARSGMWVELQ